MDLALEPGVVLGERYRLVEPLAEGGMGSVWRAEHVALNLPVAVKVIDPRVARLELGVPRFLREARALAGLRSPHIVQVSDFGSQGSLVFLVMELLSGKTLGQRLKVERKLSADDTLRILEGVCRAMSHAHERGIVHRDLKPDNIFLCDATREHVTKVIDFGIAKPMLLDATSNTETGSGTFLGTPSYMSPEQCRAQTVDQRSDLWSIGVVAYECLVGRRLFNSLVVGEIVIAICTGELPLGKSLESLPPAFERWLTKALARDPEQRFQTASELFEGLRAALNGSADANAVHAAPTLSVPSPAQLQPEPAVGSATSQTGAVARSTPPRPGSGRRRSMAGAALLGVLVAGVALLLREPAEPRPAAPGAAAPLALGSDKPSEATGAVRPEPPLARDERERVDAGARERSPGAREPAAREPAASSVPAAPAVSPAAVSPAAVSPAAVPPAAAKPSRPAAAPASPPLELEGLRQRR